MRGRRPANSSYRRTHCARSVWNRAGTSRLRWLTTSFPTEATRSSSGTGATGEPSASGAMIRRLAVKIRYQHIIIKEGPGPGSDLYRALPQGPPPPLLLKSAKLQGWGSEGISAKSQNETQTRKNIRKTAIFRIKTMIRKAVMEPFPPLPFLMEFRVTLR